MKAKIISTGSFIPARRVTNRQLYQKVANFDVDQARDSFLKKGLDVENESSELIFDRWVQRVCGIKERPFVDDELIKQAKDKTEVEYMGYLASKKAIEQADLDPQSIEQVIFATYSTNRSMPSAGCTLVQLLGLENTSAITLNGACSGFLDGLIDAVVRIEAGVCDTVLVVASEQLSNKMNYEDPKTAIIFSDGAGAAIVTRKASGESDESGVLGFASGVSYSEQVYMERLGSIFFNSGPLVERNAVRTMLSIGKKALEKSDKSFSDIDVIIPHQANVRIIDSFEKVIKQKNENVHAHMVRCIKEYGNLSGATVPVALDLFSKSVIDQGVYKKDSLFLLTSVGGGYTYSGLVLRF